MKSRIFEKLLGMPNMKWYIIQEELKRKKNKQKNNANNKKTMEKQCEDNT